MADAFSIISLVIFFAPSAFACAHNTPGKSVPARPIPEHVFMKFRRSSIFILRIGQSAGARVRYHSIRRPGRSSFYSHECEESERRHRDRFFILERKELLYDARILKGVFMARFAKCFVVLSVLLLTSSTRHLQTPPAGNPP